MQKRVTITKIKKQKSKEKLVMLTAYDALFAKIFGEFVDMILVGDSLNMSFYGKPDTLSATLEQMIYHTQAVCNGTPQSFVICDMPYGSYTNKREALKNALRVYKETLADAVKLEGGKERASLIKHLVRNGIAVMGHIGLLPQHVRSQGGYKVQSDRKKLLEDAKALEEAGCFSIVVEGVKADIAKEVTDTLSIPVIGIGAGADVDGQVLVWSDMLGLFSDFKPKFVREYLQGSKLIKEAIQQYVQDVRSGNFPSQEESYL